MISGNQQIENSELRQQSTSNSNQQDAVTKRESKQMRMEQAISQRRISKILWTAGIIAVLILVVSGIIWLNKRKSKNTPGVYYPSLGQDLSLIHI